MGGGRLNYQIEMMVRGGKEEGILEGGRDKEKRWDGQTSISMSVCLFVHLFVCASVLPFFSFCPFFLSYVCLFVCFFVDSTGPDSSVPWWPPHFYLLACLPVCMHAFMLVRSCFVFVVRVTLTSFSETVFYSQCVCVCVCVCVCGCGCVLNRFFVVRVKE